METYEVESGEGLYAIAQKILGDGSRYMEFLSWNPSISDPNVIYEGQLIMYPRDEASDTWLASQGVSPSAPSNVQFSSSSSDLQAMIDALNMGPQAPSSAVLQQAASQSGTYTPAVVSATASLPTQYAPLTSGLKLPPGALSSGVKALMPQAQPAFIGQSDFMKYLKDPKILIAAAVAIGAAIYLTTPKTRKVAPASA